MKKTDSQTFNDVLESAVGNGGKTTELLKRWKDTSPEAQVLAARKILHSAVTPTLRESGLPTEDVEVIFESIFRSYERATERSGMRTSST